MDEIANTKVTVVNLCYNTGVYVLNTLNSIKQQTYQDIDLIIIDDASTDNSVELIENWIKTTNTDCTFIKHPSNKGICASLNEALQLAKGELFAAIGDDIWHPTFLQKCVRAFHHPLSSNLGVVYSAIQKYNYAEDRYEKCVSLQDIAKKHTYPRIEQWIQDIGDSYFLLSQPLMHDILFWYCPVNAICACSKTEYLKQVGGYDASLPFEDYDMWLKMAQKHDFMYINEVLADYVINGKGFLATKKYTMSKGEMIIMLKHYTHIAYSDTKKHIRKRLKDRFFWLKEFSPELFQKEWKSILVEILKKDSIAFLRILKKVIKTNIR